MTAQPWARWISSPIANVSRHISPRQCTNQATVSLHHPQNTYHFFHLPNDQKPACSKPPTSLNYYDPKEHTMASTKPLIAFYGATGGCTLAALIPALIANYDCTARTSPLPPTYL